jgi:flagellar basal-body rod protein FlgG
MNRGTYPLASSMINGLNRIDIISNNLANVNTAGFKSEALTQGTFNAYLDRSKQTSNQQDISKESISDKSINQISNTIPKIDSKYINQAVGNINITDNNMDFALKEPNHFFKIQLPNGKIALTRDGQFHVSGNNIVNSQGYNVLDKNGESLSIKGDISQQIGITKVDFKNITKIGDNNYLETNQQNSTQIRPTSDILIRGAVEKSNVNAIKSMVNLIEAHREFELNQKALMTIDNLNDKSINKVGATS